MVLDAPEVVHDIEPDDAWRGCCISIGNFDGIHLGHLQLLDALRAMKERHGGPGVVVTFHPHPAEVLGHKKPQRLLPIDDRVRMLLANGADAVWVIPFSREFGQVPAGDFIARTLSQKLAVKGVVVGPDCRFGANREGDAGLLALHGARAGFEVEVVPPFELDGERISSTLVRRLLLEGKVERAGTLLGRPYRMKGEVVRGMQMGTRLGFPTANLCLAEELLLPAKGIYLIRVRLGDEPVSSPPLEGVANVGTRPTMDDGDILVEAHLFEVRRPLYGEQITIEFIKRLRDELKFDSLQALKEAIARDVRVARDWFAANRRQV